MKKKKINKKLNEFGIDDLLVSTVNQIVNWHNDDATLSGCKQLSFDLINEVSGAVFKHLEIPYNGEVKLDKDMKNEVVKLKQQLFTKEGAK